MSNRLVPFPGTFDQREERTVMVQVARLVLRTTAGPLRGQQFVFEGGVFVIGRAQTCTISIPSQAVSRAHARIEYADGGYWIIPEKTVNGTRVNGNLINEPTQLADKDKIAIDDSAFVISCRTPGEDLDFDDLAAPPPVEGSRGPQRGLPRNQPPYGRDSITSMSAPARPSVPIATTQLAGQLESPGFPVRPTGPIPAPEPYRMPSSPSFAPPLYGAPPYPYYPPPPAAASRSRLGMWFFAGVSVLAIVVVAVVVTVKLVVPAQPPLTSAPIPVPSVPSVPTSAVAPAPVARAPSPPGPVSETNAAPQPAPVEPVKPAPVEPVKPAPPEQAAPRPTAVLAIETTPMTTVQRGTIIDVVRVGTAVKHEGAVGRIRLYSANFESAAAKLVTLQRKYGTSEEYADFIAEAKQDYLAAARRREVKVIASDAAGTVTRVKVKAGDEVRPDQVIAELAVARITVPVEAVDGTGKKCTAELPAKKSVKGTLLSVGSTERTIELDAVPKDVAAGELGDVKIHCP